MSKPWDEGTEHRAREIPAGSGKKIRYIYEQWSADGQRWERVNKGDVPKKELDKLEKAAKRAEGKGDGPLRAPRRTSKKEPPPWWTTEDSDDETPNPIGDRIWVGRNKKSIGNNTPWKRLGDPGDIADRLQKLIDDNPHLSAYKLRFTITRARRIDGKKVSYALQGQDPVAVFADWLQTFSIGSSEMLTLEWSQFEDYTGDEVKAVETEDDDVPF